MPLACSGTDLQPDAAGRSDRMAGRMCEAIVADLDVRILTEEGEMPRHLTLNPTKNYQAIGRS